MTKQLTWQSKRWLAIWNVKTRDMEPTDRQGIRGKPDLMAVALGEGDNITWDLINQANRKDTGWDSLRDGGDIA